MEDKEISIVVKDFTELILNVLREVFHDCQVITVVVALTDGECSDDGVVRSNDPLAGRILAFLVNEFPLKERCKKVGNIGRVSVVETGGGSLD